MADSIPAWATSPKKIHGSGLAVISEPPAGSEDKSQRWYVSEKAAYLLGRNGQAVDICISHKSASRVHASLAYDRNGHLFLVDLGSAHGTFLNGERLNKHAMARIVAGDTCKFAACPLVYRLQSESPEAVREDSRSREASLAANGAAPPDRSPVRSKDSDRHAPVRNGGSGRRPSHDDEHARVRDGRDSDGDGGRHSRRDGSCSSERGAAAVAGQHAQHRRECSRSNERAVPSASRDRDGGKRAQSPPRHDGHRTNGRTEGGRGAAKPYSRRSPAPRRPSPVPRRPSPVPRRPQQLQSDERRRRLPEEGRKRRRSPSYSPVRPAGGGGLLHARRCGPEDAARGRGLETLEREWRAGPLRFNQFAVRSMMGVPAGGSTLAVEQKKKLLWGSKKAEAPASGPIAGHNRWDTAEFSSDADKDKFQRLMGVKRVADAEAAAAQPQDPLFDRQLPQKEQQERLQGDLERSFLEGVRRGNRHTVGLGL